MKYGESMCSLYVHEMFTERTNQCKGLRFRSHLPGFFIALASLEVTCTSPLHSFADTCFCRFRFFFLVSALLEERLPSPFPPNAQATSSPSSSPPRFRPENLHPQKS